MDVCFGISKEPFELMMLTFSLLFQLLGILFRRHCLLDVTLAPSPCVCVCVCAFFALRVDMNVKNRYVQGKNEI